MQLKTKESIFLKPSICSLVYTQLQKLATTIVLSVAVAQKSGRGERIRTSGLHVPNVALYQAKLHPEGSQCNKAGWFDPGALSRFFAALVGVNGSLLHFLDVQ